ncbi:YkgJ family cysteine cluster protein [Blastomonas aquatica]|uniref:Zinc/iron-chelating domain-containing protein n=1 Tax=Blastomonas aquatica TaxID=1510276 RepID=A0ABQ1JUJ0_9SPHN|nr:YkgJ family cysteine cluster protein [Blastomonas aquatica]GGB75065.1 hypothetical protein GCM10010833_32860 [Blastomonas aquatica]
MSTEQDLETILLGPVLADRDCGACTACCSVLTVNTPEFKKPAGTPCINLTGQGCSIHAVRPPICRTWFCAWRRVAEMPDAARPDRSGLLVSLNFVREPRNCLEAVSFNVRKIGDDAIDDAMARTILDSLCERLVAVWFSDGSSKMLMHPESDVASLVISGDTAPAHLREEVAAWRTQYGVFAGSG